MTHLRLSSLNHVSHVCKDVAKSAEFYQNVLGFLQVQRPQSFEFEGCWLWGFGIGIHLIQGDPVPRPSEINPRADHLSFQAEDLDEVERQLQAMGIKYVQQHVVEGGTVVRQLFFHTPDNDMIEVCNCDCLPVVPLGLDLGRCATCALEADNLCAQLPHHGCSHHNRPCRVGPCQEASSRDSMDSSSDSLRSECFAP